MGRVLLLLLATGTGICHGGTLYTCVGDQGKSLQSSPCPEGTETRKSVALDQAPPRKAPPLVDERPAQKVLQGQPYKALGRMLQGKPPI